MKTRFLLQGFYEGEKFSIFHINSQLIEVKSTVAFHALIP